MLKTITQTKQCTKCKEVKNIEFFNKRKKAKDGMQSSCKACAAEYRIANSEILAEKQREYKKENAEKIAKYQREYHKANAEKISEKQRAYNIANAMQIAKNSRAWRIANAEKISDKQREWCIANAEILAKKKREYRSANAEILAEKKREYQKVNAERIAKYQQEYRQTPMGRAAIKNARNKRRTIIKQGDVTTKQLLELQQNAKVCYWCNESLKNKEVHIDHYTPIAKGGLHDLSNLVVSCEKCNLAKNSKDPLEFAISKGKLL